MKYVREHINEKFEEESDPVEDLGIGVKASIEYSLKLLQKLNKRRENIKIKGYYEYTGLHDKYGVLIRIEEKNADIKMISYFNNLAVESGLDKFLDMDDNIVNDEFREAKFTFTKQIIWVIKNKYKKYFSEIHA